jgi:hypothetical protein
MVTSCKTDICHQVIKFLDNMEFTLALTIDSNSMGENVAQKKSLLINDFFKQVNDYIKKRDYGDDIKQCLIGFYVVNPPKGYEHLHKDFKPKYTEHKVLTNRLTGDKIEIEKQFHYSIKINGAYFEEFVSANETESRMILAQEILNSLSNLDFLPKKVNDFDKEKLKSDMKTFFKEHDLL